MEESADPQEPPEPVSRRPKNWMSVEQADKLRKFLNSPDCPRKADGSPNITQVARYCGLGYTQTYSFVIRDRYQRTKLANVDSGKLVPSETTMVEGQPNPTITLTDEQIREYQSLVRQNKRMLAKDWEALGMTAEAGARMEKYGTLGAAPTGQLMRTVAGQLISNLDLLDQVVKKDAEMILTGRIPDEPNGDGSSRDPEAVERDWRYALYAGIKLQQDMFVHVHKVQALMARVMREWQETNKNKRKGPKGVFEETNAA